MNKNIVIAGNKSWNKSFLEELLSATGQNIIMITKAEELNYENLVKLDLRYIFFFHWSNLIPAEIYENFECVIFHMTDVPFGRGGSPLQNLIARGIYETKLTALKCVKDLDAGPVYLKKSLSLHGNAEEIYLRATRLSAEMMLEILSKEIIPEEQKGEPTIFKRRKPEEGNIVGKDDLQEIYDFIRMLDAEGYPRAFLNIGKINLEFERAALKDGYIKADVTIRLRGAEEHE